MYIYTCVHVCLLVPTGSRDSSMVAWKVPDMTTLLVEEKLSLSSLMSPWPTNHPMAESVPSIDMLFRFSNHVTQRSMSGNKVRSLVCNRRTHVS